MADILFEPKDIPKENVENKCPHRQVLENHLKKNHLSLREKNQAIGALYKKGDQKFVDIFFRVEADNELAKIADGVKRRRGNDGSQVITEIPSSKRTKGRAPTPKPMKGRPVPLNAPRRAWIEPMKHNAEILRKDSEMAAMAMKKTTFDLIRGIPNIDENDARDIVNTAIAASNQISTSVAAIGGPGGNIMPEGREALIASGFERLMQVKYDMIMRAGGEKAVQEFMDEENDTNVEFIMKGLLGNAKMIDKNENGDEKIRGKFMGLDNDFLMEIGEKYTKEFSIDPEEDFDDIDKLFAMQKGLMKAYEDKAHKEGNEDGFATKILMKITAILNTIRARFNKFSEDYNLGMKIPESEGWLSLGRKAVKFVLKVVIAAILVSLVIYFGYKISRGFIDVKKYTEHAEEVVGKMNETRDNMQNAVNSSVEEGKSYIDKATEGIKKVVVNERSTIERKDMRIREYNQKSSLRPLTPEEKELYDEYKLDKKVAETNLRTLLSAVLPQLGLAKGKFDSIQETVEEHVKMLSDYSGELMKDFEWIKWAYQLTVSGSPVYTGLTRAAKDSFNKTIGKKIGFHISDSLLIFIENVCNLESIGQLEKVVVALMGNLGDFWTGRYAGVADLFVNMAAGVSNFYSVIFLNPIARAAYRYSVFSTSKALAILSKLTGYGMLGAFDLIVWIFAGKDQDFDLKIAEKYSPRETQEYSFQFDEDVRMNTEEEPGILDNLFSFFTSISFGNEYDDYDQLWTGDSIIGVLDWAQSKRDKYENCPSDSNYKRIVCEIFVKFIPSSTESLIVFNDFLLDMMSMVSTAISIIQAIQMIFTFFCGIGGLFVLWISSATFFIGGILVAALLISAVVKFERTRKAVGWVIRFMYHHPTLTMFGTVAFVGFVQYWTGLKPEVAEGMKKRMNTEAKNHAKQNANELEKSYYEGARELYQAPWEKKTTSIPEKDDYSFFMNYIEQNPKE